MVAILLLFWASICQDLWRSVELEAFVDSFETLAGLCLSPEQVQICPTCSEVYLVCNCSDISEGRSSTNASNRAVGRCTSRCLADRSSSVQLRKE